MKTLLLLIAALASLDASAADWRQYLGQPAVDYFFDGDSVKRTPGTFEAVIRRRVRRSLKPDWIPSCAACS